MRKHFKKIAVVAVVTTVAGAIGRVILKHYREDALIGG
jgi:hypothetical protein